MDEAIAKGEAARVREAEVFGQLVDRWKRVVLGASLAVKLLALGGVALIWLGISSELAIFTGRNVTDMLLLAALTAVLVQTLASGIRWRWVLSAVTAGGCIAVLGWATMNESRLAHWQWVELAGAIGVGAGLGHLVFALVSRVTRGIRVSRHSAGLFPTLGLTATREDYRGEVERALAWAEEWVAGGLQGLRTLVVSSVSLMMMACACGWIWNHWAGGVPSRNDLVIWGVLGAVSGALVAVALLPKGKRWLVGTLGVWAVGIAGAGLLVVHPVRWDHFGQTGWSVMPTLWVMLTAGGSAVVAALVVRSGARLMARLLPAVIRAHAMGEAVHGKNTPAELAEAVTCEGCGYQLQGLSASTCSRCGVMELRCPECGHLQAAQALHGRGLLRWYKAHAVVRLLWWLAVVGVGGLLAFFPWYLLGMQFAARAEYFDWSNLWAGVAISAIFVTPLRMLFLRWRPAWLVSLGVALLPAGVFALGGLISGPGVIAWSGWWFVPGWVGISLVTPVLWHVWLWLRHGQEAQAVRDWVRCRGFRHADVEAVAGERACLGREWPVACACGQVMKQEELGRCEACGVISGECPACGGRPTVSLVRVGAENLLWRGRQMIQALTAAGGGVGMVVAGMVMLAWVANRRQMLMSSYWEMWSDFLMWLGVGLACGLIWRLLLLRTRTWTAAMVVLGYTLFWGGVVPVCWWWDLGSMSDLQTPWLRICTAAMTGTTLVAALAGGWFWRMVGQTLLGAEGWEMLVGED